MTKGFAHLAVIATSALIGVLVGTLAVGMMIQAANINQNARMILADTRSYNSMYQARNVQEYLEFGRTYILAEYAQKGGPDTCGAVSFGDGLVSVWKNSEDCTPYSASNVIDQSRLIAMDVAALYASSWNVGVAEGDEDKFCLTVDGALPFGDYKSRACFRSTITSNISAMIIAMDDAFEGDWSVASGQGDCVCKSSYWICWRPVQVDGFDYNFTYAVRENC